MRSQQFNRGRIVEHLERDEQRRCLPAHLHPSIGMTRTDEQHNRDVGVSRKQTQPPELFLGPSQRLAHLRFPVGNYPRQIPRLGRGQTSGMWAPMSSVVAVEDFSVGCFVLFDPCFEPLWTVGYGGEQLVFGHRRRNRHHARIQPCDPNRACIALRAKTPAIV